MKNKKIRKIKSIVFVGLACFFLFSPIVMFGLILNIENMNYRLVDKVNLDSYSKTQQITEVNFRESYKLKGFFLNNKYMSQRCKNCDSSSYIDKKIGDNIVKGEDLFYFNNKIEKANMSGQIVKIFDDNKGVVIESNKHYKFKGQIKINKAINIEEFELYYGDIKINDFVLSQDAQNIVIDFKNPIIADKKSDEIILKSKKEEKRLVITQKSLTKYDNTYYLTMSNKKSEILEDVMVKIVSLDDINNLAVISGNIKNNDFFIENENNIIGK